MKFEDIYIRKSKLIKNDLCDICGVTEAIKHLLFECQHAQQIWHFISDSLECNISLENIFLGTDNHIRTYIISIISFIIYKEWLIGRNEHTLRAWRTTLPFLKRELSFRYAVFEIIEDRDMMSNMKTLVQALTVL